MCLRPKPAFVSEPLHDASTTIFARLNGDRQWLGYALRADIAEELSVAIPLPIALGTEPSEIRLHSLHEFPGFFTMLQKPFPRAQVEAPLTRGPGRATPEALDIVFLGDYAASVAPDASALARVRPELALRPTALELLPEYATFAFVILRLKPPRKVAIDPRVMRTPVEHHAVLIDFPSRFPGKLFFPTLVAQNGELPQHAAYDHLLFCQTGSDRHPEAGWERSARHVGRYVLGQTAPAVDTSRHVFRRSIRGNYPNQDLELSEPASF
jgi:hypothetical protein